MRQEFVAETLVNATQRVATIPSWETMAAKSIATFEQGNHGSSRKIGDKTTRRFQQRHLADGASTVKLTGPILLVIFISWLILSLTVPASASPATQTKHRRSVEFIDTRQRE